MKNKHIFEAALCMIAAAVTVQNSKAKEMSALEYLNFGEVVPSGWMAEQMKTDLHHGFVGHLDQLAPDLIVEDDIYGKDRLTKKVKGKDVGVEIVDQEWEVQFLWWNSETQSNWWDGVVRHTLLVGNEEDRARVDAYVQDKLATQDEDGYIGIYAEDLRYDHSTENGELWAQASLFRGLLAYYEATGKAEVLEAIERAIQLTMQAYPIWKSQPFAIEKPFAGVGHGLTFTDVLDRLHQLTGKKEYLDYAVFLYADYCKHPLAEVDIQVSNLLDEDYRFKGHGVHTYEHLRALAIAACGSDEQSYQQALDASLEKLPEYISPSGGPIGDEWIFEQIADSEKTGYEYCSIHELFDSYGLLLQKTGNVNWADAMEWLIFNAAQGARHPHESSIAYCKTDNAYHAKGGLNDDPDGKNHGKRFKYSPAHQDVAVCCVPNAGRIYPYYFKNAWMKSSGGVVALLFGESVLETDVQGEAVKIVQETNYPFDHSIRFVFEQAPEGRFDLAIRKPLWADGYSIEGAAGVEKDGVIHLKKIWKNGDSVNITFDASPKSHLDYQERVFFSYGPLVYALPLEPGEEVVSRSYSVSDFRDLRYEMTTDPAKDSTLVSNQAKLIGCCRAGDSWQHASKLEVKLQSAASGEVSTHQLIPMGSTLMRRVSFERSN